MDRTSTAWTQLSQRILSVEQIREVDRVAVEQFRMNSLVLMENAAIGCVQWLNRRCRDGGDAVVLCGRGNNGGDGMAIARHLRVIGWRCRVVALGPAEQMSSDARANYEVLSAAGGRDLMLWDTALSVDKQLFTVETWLDSATCVIDAMLGTGAAGEPRSPLSDWIQLANKSDALRVAIDIPSGWDATTGQASASTFRADATLTFVARKPAMADPAAHNILGEITVLPIGITEEQITQLLSTAR